jgi:hypothetical protein
MSHVVMLKTKPVWYVGQPRIVRRGCQRGESRVLAGWWAEE